MYLRAAVFAFAIILAGLGFVPAAGVAQNGGTQYEYGVTNQTHLGGIPGVFNLKADFMTRRDGARPVAVATIQLKLWPGSKDRLIERGGNYVWTP